MKLLTSTKLSPCPEFLGRVPHFSIAVIKHPGGSSFFFGGGEFILNYAFKEIQSINGGEDSRHARQDGRGRRLAGHTAFTHPKQRVNRKWNGL